MHITRGALGADSGRSGAGGRAGPRDHPHHRAAHHPRDSEEQEHPDGRRRDAVRQRRARSISVVDNVYLNIIDNSFGRAEENESDEKGVALANKLGYAPQGLSGFLTRLQERNKDATEKRGLFASHPEMKERLDRLAKQIATQKLAGEGDASPIAISKNIYLQAGARGQHRASSKPVRRDSPAAAPPRPKRSRQPSPKRRKKSQPAQKRAASARSAA